MSSKNELIGAITCALPGMDPKNLRLVRDVSNRLNSGDASLWHSRFAKALRDKLPKEEKRQLHFLKPVVLAVSVIFDPQLLTTGKGIWLSPEFIDRILSVAEPLQSTDDFPLPSVFDVVEPGNDSEIRSELPKDHIYEASEFCWRLYKMTQCQPNGTPGKLLVNGFNNIFYVTGIGGEVFVVCAGWSSDDRRWCINCWSLARVKWSYGPRAFSRN